MSVVETAVATVASKLDSSPAVIVVWRSAWKMHSVQANAVGALFNMAAAAAAQAFAAATLIVIWPVTVVLLIGAALFLAGMIGRVLVQPKLAGKMDASDSAGV